MPSSSRFSLAPRSGTDPGSTASALLSALQQENDTLRSQLLQSQRDKEVLRKQLEAATAAVATATVNYDNVVAQQQQLPRQSAKQIKALRQRCQLLADRLLSTVRDQQLAQSSEVYFLLRTQQEERRFLMEALEGLLEELQVEDTRARAERQRQMYSTHQPLSAAVSQSAGGKDGASATLSQSSVSTGTICRLMMMASEGLQMRAAEAKLEKARARLALEQATQLTQELQSSVEQAARAVFGVATFLETQREEESRRGGSGAAGLLQWDSTILSHSRDDSARRDSAHRGEAGSWVAVTEELLWGCDVLKACFRGMNDVRSLMDAACGELTAPSSRSGFDEKGLLTSTGATGRSLPASASPEMERLLQSFLEDLHTITTRSAQQQERLARRLSHEVQCHYESAKQYESQIKLLETENSRLLAAAPREASQQRGPTTTDGAGDSEGEEESSFQPSLPPKSVAPLSFQLRSLAERGGGPGEAAGRSVAVVPPAPGAGNSAPKSGTTYADLEEDDLKATPERLVRVPHRPRHGHLGGPAHLRPRDQSAKTPADETGTVDRRLQLSPRDRGNARAALSRSKERPLGHRRASEDRRASSSSSSEAGDRADQSWTLNEVSATTLSSASPPRKGVRNAPTDVHRPRPLRQQSNRKTESVSGSSEADETSLSAPERTAPYREADTRVRRRTAAPGEVPRGPPPHRGSSRRGGEWDGSAYKDERSQPDRPRGRPTVAHSPQRRLQSPIPRPVAPAEKEAETTPKIWRAIRESHPRVLYSPSS